MKNENGMEKTKAVTELSSSLPINTPSQPPVLHTSVHNSKKLTLFFSSLFHLSLGLVPVSSQ